MTFQAFTRARRLAGALNHICEGGALDAAVFESGYESHSGFRDAFARTFGDTPGRYRNGECVFLSWLRSPLGPLVAGATAQGVCLLEFTDRRMLEAQFAAVRRLFDTPVVLGSNEYLEMLRGELASYFAGSSRSFSVPLTYPGTPFQRRVWEQLLAIPYGETRSYQELAVAVGEPRAVRAVGRANGLNRISILIPCHRVVNKDGELVIEYLLPLRGISKEAMEVYRRHYRNPGPLRQPMLTWSRMSLKFVDSYACWLSTSPIPIQRSDLAVGPYPR